jgi:hypothetical protein
MTFVDAQQKYVKNNIKGLPVSRVRVFCVDFNQILGAQSRQDMP